MICDNYSEAHDLEVITEDQNAVRCVCKVCKHQVVCRKDERGVPEKRQYAEAFKRWILQPHENLFYKYRPQYLRQ